jgi:uncharacterized protein YwgA
MTRYQLAKIVDWADCLHTRKRLQKVVYLLQSAGCPLEAEYILHHYGPYSEEVARLTDEMVRTSALAEQMTATGVGPQYSYHLPEATRQQIASLEATDSGRAWAVEVAPFEPLAKELLRNDSKQLEHAATIVFFRRQGYDWDVAVEKAVAFKKTEKVRDARALASKVFPS